MSVQVVQTINQDTTAYLTVSFFDKDGAPLAPSGVTYRVDCLTNVQQVRDDTVLVPAASIEIKLAPSDNIIIGETNAHERRLVTVHAVYGVADEVNEEYEYRVKNLRKIPLPVP